MKQLHLVPAQEGEVELLQPFWNIERPNEFQGIVPPLLAFTDLSASLDSRNQEAAAKLKKEYNV